MISFRPTKIEQYAIEAKLNLMFGANVYDRIFLGFEVLEIVDGELRGWAPTEYGAERRQGARRCSFRGALWVQARAAPPEQASADHPTQNGEGDKNLIAADSFEPIKHVSKIHLASQPR